MSKTTKWNVEEKTLVTLFEAIQDKWIKSVVNGEPESFTDEEGRAGYELAAAISRRGLKVKGVGCWLGYGGPPRAAVAAARPDGFFPAEHYWTYFSPTGERIGVVWEYKAGRVGILHDCPDILADKAALWAGKLCMTVFYR